MRILVTGAKGQLGSQIIRIIKDGKSELGFIDKRYRNADLIGIDIEELDISDSGKVEKYLRDVNPDVVINTAAYTDVDGCEDNLELAFKANSLGPKNLAIACEKINSKLIHISTDYVFEGNGTTPYKEYDIPNPISVYGKTKYEGEQYIKSFSSKYFIIRTSWVYGYMGKNFVKTMMKYGKERGKLNVVNDQRGNPTSAEDLAHHILKILLTDQYGVYHCTGNGECTWYEFACEIIKVAEIECEINPVDSETFSQRAKRPSYSSMDNLMLRVTVGDEMRDWKTAVNEYIRKYQREKDNGEF